MSKIGLLFDSFITNEPLFPNKKLDEIKSDIYRGQEGSFSAYPSAVDISRYTLSTYSDIGFDYVLLNAEIDQKDELNKFETTVQSIFSDYEYSPKRTLSPADHNRLYDKISSIDIDWFFYSPNYDHPFLGPDPTIIRRIVDQLESYPGTDYKSIIYSHFQESWFQSYDSNPYFSAQWGNEAKVLSNSDYGRILLIPRGYSVGMQIVSKKLLLEWIRLASKRVQPTRRYDELPSSSLPGQITLIPDRELCRHFDGYYHTLVQFPHLAIVDIQPSYTPPCFIPAGFFENQIRIRYGFASIINGCVNINPNADFLSFESRPLSGAVISDTRLLYELIPYSWLSRSSSVEQSSDFVLSQTKSISNLIKEYSVRHNLTAFQIFKLNFGAIIKNNIILSYPVIILIKLLRKSGIVK